MRRRAFLLPGEGLGTLLLRRNCYCVFFSFKAEPFGVLIYFIIWIAPLTGLKKRF